MSHRLEILVLQVACLAAATVPLPSEAAPPAQGSPSSFQELDPVQWQYVVSLPPLTLAQMNGQVAAAVSVDVPTKGGKRQVVQRKAGVNAAVYTGLPASAPPLLPAPLNPGDWLSFQTTGNLAQAWATMTTDGVPHLRVRGAGEFRAEGTASWTATYTLGGTTAKELVLRFVVPRATFDNYTDAGAAALWRSRVRAELLVNGYPAWSTEGLMLRTDLSDANAPVQQALLQQFGSPLAFSTNDEDDSAANDTNAQIADSASVPREVKLSLGRFSPGQTVNLQFVARGTAFTVPTMAGGTDHRCKSDNVGGWWCSQASISLLNATAADAPRLYLAP